MAESNDPKVTRRDTLRLATAVGALGAGLGVTIGGKDALAGPLSYKEYKEVSIKEQLAEKVMLPASDFGSVSLKITVIKLDGTPQLLHAFDLTSHFLKLDLAKGESVNFLIQSHKEQKDITLLNRSIFIKEQKI
jgi:hypothetical protein